MWRHGALKGQEPGGALWRHIYYDDVISWWGGYLVVLVVLRVKPELTGFLRDPEYHGELRKLRLTSREMRGDNSDEVTRRMQARSDDVTRRVRRKDGDYDRWENGEDWERSHGLWATSVDSEAAFSSQFSTTDVTSRRQFFDEKRWIERIDRSETQSAVNSVGQHCLTNWTSQHTVFSRFPQKIG